MVQILSSVSSASSRSKAKIALVEPTPTGVGDRLAALLIRAARRRRRNGRAMERLNGQMEAR